MQDYNPLLPSGLISDDRQTINDNMESIITDFSGTAFPTNNLYAGMKCNRTDQSKVYQLQDDLATWKQIYDYSGTEITVPKANKAVLDVDGNPIKTTYLKSVPVYTGATTTAAGTAGLVKAPEITDREKFLKGNGEWAEVPKLTKLDLLDMIYPVGSIYMSVNSSNPGSLFGGTWQAYAQGRVLIGAGTGTDSRSEKKTFAAGSTGGEYNHQLTVGELASHNHSASTNSASLTGAIDTTDDNTNDRRIGTGDASGILSSRETASVMRYGSGGFVSARTGISINASHSHSVTVNSNGSNTAHNNTQPYITAYIWRRTA